MEKNLTMTYYDMEADSGSAVKATCISCSYVTVSSNFKVNESLSQYLSSLKIEGKSADRFGFSEMPI